MTATPRRSSRLVWTVTVRDDTRPRDEQRVMVHPCPDLWQAIVLTVVVRQFWPALRVSLTRHWSPNVADHAAITGAATSRPVVAVNGLALTTTSPAALTLPRGERSPGGRTSADSIPVSAQALTGGEGPDSNTDRRVAA